MKRRLAGALALLFALNIAIITLAQSAQAATYRMGSSGEQVRTIQTKLKNWGYYSGAVDGIYGAQTAKAVEYFQRKNGLTADGIVGPATLRALGMENSVSTGGAAAGQADSLALLARVISAEARGEPYSGQVAVGAVIMNRVRSASYPNSIEAVIYQSGQFTPASTGWLDRVRNSRGYTATSMQAAADALAGANPIGGCLYFDQGGRGMKIGAHYFH